jgi:circadian clock protein KaiC
MERVSTGNPPLDAILQGGFPRGSINILMGRPGSGKTILAEQLTFANASEQRPALYLTTLSEPLSKVLAYLQELEFARVECIGTAVLYESLAEPLKSGAQGLVEHVLTLLKRHRPGVIVIDSFKAVADLMPDTQSWRRLVFELAGLLSAYDATSLWVGEYTSEMVPGMVEFAVADGIVELDREQRGSHDERFLRVVKLRGSHFLDGKHAFVISRAGLRVFPRLVTPAAPRAYRPEPERLQTGVAGLDALLDAGWLRGTSTLVAGPSGAGKTMLGLHFLRDGVERGEPGLLVCFQENPVQLARAMRSLGWQPDALLGPERLDLLYSSPVELQVDTIVQEIVRRIEDNGVTRVILDALGDLKNAAQDPRRYADFVYSLIQYFAASNVTALLVLEVLPGADRRSGLWSEDVSYMCDNIALLGMDLGDDLVRTIRITKSRGSAHDGRRHLLRIGKDGMAVD